MAPTLLPIRTGLWFVALLCLIAPAAAQPRLGAHLQYDLTRFGHAPAPLQDASGARRLRLSLAIGESGRPEARLQYDFESRSWTDAYFRLPLAAGTLTVGQFKPPFSADTLISDSQALFTENAASGVFAPGRRLGVQYAGKRAAVALYSRDLSGAGPEVAAAARGFATAGDEQRRWHGGISLAAERHASGSFRQRLRPEVGPDSGSWVSGPAFSADRSLRGGIEAGLQNGRWLLLGELFRTDFEADERASGNLHGGFLTAVWSLHGAPRSYKSGLFIEPKPVAGRLGSVELAVRYSDVALHSATGAGQRSLSIGLNAQVSGHWRLQFDRHDVRRDSDRRDAGAWTLRLQYLY
jgi:phosphate-selective porin OprO/OprP